MGIYLVHSFVYSIHFGVLNKKYSNPVWANLGVKSNQARPETDFISELLEADVA